MRLRDHEMPLDPDVERELEAVDHALHGLRVATDLEDIRDLAVDARADRPALEPDFGTRLDQWAAAGFPREGRPGGHEDDTTGSALSGMFERLRSVPPRRLLLPVGAAATLVVAVAVAIGVSDQLGRPSGGSPSETGVATPASSGSVGTAEAARASRTPSEAAPGAPESQNLDGQLQQLTPNVRAGFARRDQVTNAGAIGAVGSPTHRKVAQNVDLVLATEPQKVRDVADSIVGVVDKYHGFVVSSNVTSGRTPPPTPVPLQEDNTGRQRVEGSGTFELRIPAQRLQDALRDMSAIDGAHVASRTEGTRDITKRFNAAEARVHDLEAQRDYLLKQLANALTLTEQESLQQRINIVEHDLADAKNHLGHVQQRIHMVPVTVEIQGQRGVDSGGAWSIGDAFHDAGRVLTVIAGILLISLAVLAPLGLIGAAAWITTRAVIRRRREGALE
jgi:hypothetical protein